MAQFGLYKILFHFEAFVHEPVPFIARAHMHCPHYCNTIARPLRNIPPPTPLLYVIHQTTLVMSISCKG